MPALQIGFILVNDTDTHRQQTLNDSTLQDIKNTAIYDSILFIIEETGKDITLKLKDMSMTATQKPIEKKEIDELQELLHKNMKMVNNLKETINKPYPDDDKLMEKYEKRSTEVSSQCEENAKCIEMVEHIWKQLLPIVMSIEEVLGLPGSIDLSEKYLNNDYKSTEIGN